MGGRPLSWLLRPSPRGITLGLAVAAAFVAVEALLIFALKEAAPAVSLGVVYLLGVLVIATAWGRWLGIATCVASALAFNFFHIPPTGRFTIADGENWVALVIFVAVALLAGSVADLARARTAEAYERRREADLADQGRSRGRREDRARTLLPSRAHRARRPRALWPDRGGRQSGRQRGLHAADVAWLLSSVPGELIVLRAGGEELGVAEPQAAPAARAAGAQDEHLLLAPTWVSTPRALCRAARARPPLRRQWLDHKPDVFVSTTAMSRALRGLLDVGQDRKAARRIGAPRSIGVSLRAEGAGRRRRA